MMAHHVMLAWYMWCFEIIYGIWTSTAKKLYFCDSPGGGGGSGPLPPLWIRQWLDCFHQQTELCPYWVTLSGGIEMKQTANDKSPRNCWHVAKSDRTIIVPSPWGYRRMTVRCPYNFMVPAKASCRDLAGSLRLSQESTIIFGPIWQSKSK